jgi:hypothetical protein
VRRSAGEGGDGASLLQSLNHQAGGLPGIEMRRDLMLLDGEAAIKHTIDADGMANEVREVRRITVSLRAFAKITESFGRN